MFVDNKLIKVVVFLIFLIKVFLLINFLFLYILILKCFCKSFKFIFGIVLVI